jgi:hypothetical protein
MPEFTKVDRHSDEPPSGRARRQLADRAALIRLLDEWMQSDQAEQRATFQALRRALDEDRPAGYKLFS